MPTHISPITIVALAMVSMLSACTRVVVVDTPMEALPTAGVDAGQSGDNWWHIDFTMHWDRQDSPDMFIDTLIADQICAPALAAVGDRIRLWRFHRRAAPDAIGHRLSLRAYTDEASAESLFEHIRESSVLQWLESDEWVESVKLVERERPDEPPIARASDPNWPPAIQASWPWFIMGVSQTWLVLIKQVSAEQSLQGSSKWALLDHYQDVHKTIDAQWRAFGQHAYLHHLNAIFGYEPLVIRGNYLMTF